MSVYVASSSSNVIYDNLVKDKIENNVSISVADKNISTKNIIDILPEFAIEFIENNSSLINNLEKILGKKNIDISNEINKLFEPTVKNLIRGILTIILFWIFMIISSIIMNSISRSCRISFLYYVDGILGAGFGFVKAYFIIFFLVVLTRFLLPIINNNSDIFSEKNINSSVIFRRIYHKTESIYGEGEIVI
ncbi:MAG: hypothetical protein RsTaC01_0047 [Candidatus Paraimprobicoccus trichonymphae]|uniref:CvpA family protein n=1 Tax=Candidatus Paraimprobicoccus trichonymphae TaxID=3033793 RepID=A0AA48KYY6_9FIRM|nr:MAG: hypothetical protein RsTaC01_0047 [Candidatus Paraimprobicoccus trichonymphae]